MPPATIIASKIVCDSESDLPNWGGAQGDQSINANTATDFVNASNGKCHINLDWTFQYKTGDVANPDDNSGVASDWSTPFSSSVPVDVSASNLIKVREIWNDQYIPFTGDNDNKNVSAEFYCANDNYKYDNFDYVTSAQPGQTYYCVAFNALAAICGDGELDPATEQCDNGPDNTDDACTAEYGDTCDYCTASCQSVTITGPHCGDGIVNGEEQCDDDNSINNDACTNQCTFPTGSITGTKYEDINASGDRDTIGDTSNTEPGLSGWNIYLYQGEGPSIANTTTDAKGDYEFLGLTPGEYRVCEDNKPDWHHTDPGMNDNPCKTVTVTAGQAVTANFGNFHDAWIEGYKYEDANGNGQYDDGEQYINGWPIRLYRLEQNKKGGTSWDNTAGQGTGSVWPETGRYAWTDVPGTYYVCEVAKHDFDGSDWIQTQPAADQGVANQSGMEDEAFRCYEVVIDESGEQNTHLDFGNQRIVPTYDVHGYKWNDIDEDGYFDCENTFSIQTLTNVNTLPPVAQLCEPKLCDWTIQLKQNGEVLDETTTSCEDSRDYGWYWFEDLPAGTYEICEVQQEGWDQTYPENCHNVTLPLAQETLRATVISDNFVEDAPEFDFGNHQIPPVPVVDITKTVTVNGEETATAHEGDSLVYTITVSNTGNATAYDLRISDDLPANVTFGEDAFNPAPGVNDGTTAVWDPIDLPAGNDYVITITGTVNAGLEYGSADSLEVVNTATVEQFEFNQEVSFWQKLLGVKVAHAQAAAAPINFIHQAAVAAVNVLKPVPAICGNGTIEQAAGEECDDGALNNKPCTAGVGQTCTYCSSTCTTFTVTGEEPTPVLAVLKTVDDSLTNPGQVVTYTVTISNSGNAAAKDVKLVDTLPAGLTFADKKGKTTGDTEKTWTWKTLAAGDDVTVTYDAVIDSNTGADVYDNLATVTAKNFDGSVTAKASTEVRIPVVLGDETPELEITKTAKQTYVNPGGTVTYTVTVKNVGDAPAMNAVLTDTLPAGFVFADTGKSTKTWKLGDIVPDEVVTKTYTVKVDASTIAGKYTNLATVKADDTPVITAKAAVEVRTPKVLGAEDEPTQLPVTGAGILGLVAAAAVIIGTGVISKKRTR
ncbi:MAG: SdrD B-like domain-containing protein [Patescibacteria group bacterium]|nr:SdrD B-like domain-containing protein [Patescibacteria group bacterium]